MTGPEHYREAEKLLAFAADYEAGSITATDAVTEAQVHAMLALAAATAMSAPVDGAEAGMPPIEASAWYDVAGVKPKGGAA